jgi:hypothetical protein
MAAAQRSQGQATPAPQELPDLDPALLMSASARAEFEAARAMRGGALPQPAPPEDRPRPQQRLAAPVDLEFTVSDPIDLDFDPGTPPRYAVAAEPGLESLFMNGEANEALQVRGGSFEPEPAAYRAPEAGVVVRSRVGQSWNLQPHTLPPPRTRPEPISRAEAVARTEQQTRPSVTPTAPSAPRVSRYDRILGDD